MCRYAGGLYNRVFICLGCRVGWKGYNVRSESSIHCGRCGQPGLDMGHDFHVPRRLNRNQWKKIAKMVEAGVEWGSCGCNGPGLRPRTFADSKHWETAEVPLTYREGTRTIYFEPRTETRKGKHIRR